MAVNNEQSAKRLTQVQVILGMEILMIRKKSRV